MSIVVYKLVPNFLKKFYWWGVVVLYLCDYLIFSVHPNREILNYLHDLFRQTFSSVLFYCDHDINFSFVRLDPVRKK